MTLPHASMPLSKQQAARLSQNCKALLELIKKVDAQLARVTVSLVRRQAMPPPSMEEAMQQLMQAVMGAGKIMQVRIASTCAHPRDMLMFFVSSTCL